MIDDTINDNVTMRPQGGETADRSIGDGPTMKPKGERGGRRAFVPGDIIAGRYVVERMLGEGGMGIVYQCLDRVGGVKVAVKCLPPEVSRNADEMEDIRANYRLVSDLHHPNIAGARTLELDESTGDYYLVMDLAHGMSLKRWMKHNPQATMEVKLSILRQVAAALDYAHAKKIIHRDVKPENVMVDSSGFVKVLDFGLAAQIRSSQSRTSAAVTSKGGTPGYKSPEQWRGKAQREPADVYSFGVMAYWMFAGALPFDGDDLLVLGHAVLTEQVAPVADIPAHMNAALAKALAKQPEERFASCGEFVSALEGHTTPQGGGTQVGRMLGVIALLAALAAGAWWWSTGTTGTARSTDTTLVSPAPVVPAVSVAANEPQTNGAPRAVTEEAKRKADEEAQAKDLWVEAGVEKGRLQRISDSDGFRDQKNSLLDAFTRAEGYKNAKQWDKAIADFIGFTNGCRYLDMRNEERNDAKKKRETAVAAKNAACDAGAEQYAKSCWEVAVKLMDDGADEFGKMTFAAAATKYATAAKQFDRCVYEAKAEREKHEKKQAAERARLEKARKASAKPEAVTELTLDEQEARQKETKRLAELKFEIRSKCEDAKAKIECVAEYRGEPGVFKAHIDNADAKWKIVEEVEQKYTNLATVAEAEASLKSATDAEKAIDNEIIWLSTNKTARDGAKAIEAEIVREIDPKLKCFKADDYARDYARELCMDGDHDRGEGKAALDKGDFPAAKKKLGEAKAKLSEAVENAKKFYVRMHLKHAKELLDKSKWQQCVEECETVIGWDSANAEANKVKAEAEGHLVPTAKVVAMIDGSEVFGAKVDDGQRIHTTPINWKLEKDETYGPYDIIYESGGKRYIGTFDAVVANWQGERPFTVTLKEYTPKADNTKTLTLPGGVTMEMIYVKPGWFNMGSPKGEDGRKDDETQHKVKLTRGFWLGKYEVTQRQWQSVMGNNPSRFKGDDQPVENVSWDECQRFILEVNKSEVASRQFGGGARLPTEAEWEYACRAGSTGPYGGNGDLNDMGWYSDNSRGGSQNVGQKRPNAWGFHDMHGNVSEWCKDGYVGGYYKYNSSLSDPECQITSEGRVLRGGSWDNNEWECRSAKRFSYTQCNHNDYCGFRLAIERAQY